MRPKTFGEPMTMFDLTDEERRLYRYFMPRPDSDKDLAAADAFRCARKCLARALKAEHDKDEYNHFDCGHAIKYSAGVPRRMCPETDEDWLDEADRELRKMPDRERAHG